MSDTVVKVENISKLYRLGQVGTGTLGQDLNRWWAKVRGQEDPYAKIGQVNDRTKQAESDYVWALKDINFDVRHGEVLGIIGRNGAGKSTLLKLISRITTPTTGEIKAKGRIASLLEVGTGMHPEMTARENIYLNGAILGMRRQEIMRKFDDIVDFAGCAMYVDTPVKRYSSGMRVRLGFAVAAFLEPDILIVDEVLAVGDAEFQKKCIGKMGEISQQNGRTILFVSHNMAAVEALCTRGIVLGDGRQAFQGTTQKSIDFYLNAYSVHQNKNINEREDRSGVGHIRITDFHIQDAAGNQNTSFPVGASLNFFLRYSSQASIPNPHVIIGVYDATNVGMARFDTEVSRGTLSNLLPSQGTLICSTAPINLAPGRYSVNIAFFSNREQQDYISKAISFDIIEADYLGSGKLFDSKLSKVIFKHEWRIAS